MALCIWELSVTAAGLRPAHLGAVAFGDDYWAPWSAQSPRSLTSMYVCNISHPEMHVFLIRYGPIRPECKTETRHTVTKPIGEMAIALCS